jgi:hypothetical protein
MNTAWQEGWIRREMRRVKAPGDFDFRGPIEFEDETDDAPRLCDLFRRPLSPLQAVTLALLLGANLGVGICVLIIWLCHRGGV